MKTFTDKEISDSASRLTQPLREAIYSADIAEVIVAISAKYSITGRKISNVSGEIGYIILGLARPEEFTSRLSDRLGIKTDDARKLVQDIYQSVLKPLATELKHLYGFELNENAFNAKPPPVAPQAEPQKPATLVIPPRPVVQQTEPTPRPAPPSPPPASTQANPPPPAITPAEPRPLPPRQAPSAPPPAPNPPYPPQQRPQMPKNAVSSETSLSSPKPAAPTVPRAPRSIFSPQIPAQELPREPSRPAPEKPTLPHEPRVFTPRRPTFPPQDTDPYRETVMPQEKELQQKRDTVSDPRGTEPPFQVKRGEPPYVNPKIPPIDLRDDAPRPPAPPDPHWEKLT